MDKQQIANINRNADLATCCLTMVQVTVKMPGVEVFSIYAMPWNWLDTCKNIADSGAEWLCATAPRDCRESWMWTRPAKIAKRRSKTAKETA